jgi:hypothetical protein
MRVKTSFGTGAVAVIVAFGCAHPKPSSVDHCWPDAERRSILVREAIFALTERQQSDADELRRLADAPRDSGSIRGRLRAVTDPDICRRIAATIDPEHPKARVTAITLGRAYWAMSSDTEGIDALDGHSRIVMHVVFLR